LKRKALHFNPTQIIENAQYTSPGFKHKSIGVFAFVREVGSRTEQYWCPIKHALRVSDPHRRYYEFLEYGDAEGYRARLEAFRTALRQDKAPDAPLAKP